MKKRNQHWIEQKNVTKEELAKLVVDMGSVTSECRTVLDAATVKFDEQNHDPPASQTIWYK